MYYKQDDSYLIFIKQPSRIRRLQSQNFLLQPGLHPLPEGSLICTVNRRDSSLKITGVANNPTTILTQPLNGLIDLQAILHSVDEKDQWLSMGIS